MAIDSGTPYAQLLVQLAAGAAKTAGVKLVAINSGTTASTINAAFDSVLSEKPGAVIVPALQPQSFSQAIPKLKAAHIPVISIGITNGAAYGLNTYPNVATTGTADLVQVGQLQAAYVAAHDGPKANVAYITVPEVTFSPLVTSTFTKTLARLCPACTVHDVTVAAATIGTTAPAQIVSYLQAHPDTTVLSGVVGEAVQGVPTALAQAGVKVNIVGGAPAPGNLADLRAGHAQAFIATDTPVMAWTAVDAALRATEQQPFTHLEVAGTPPVEVLEPKDITFNPQNGWTGYPNFASLFAKLWKK